MMHTEHLTGREGVARSDSWVTTDFTDLCLNGSWFHVWKAKPRLSTQSRNAASEWGFPGAQLQSEPSGAFRCGAWARFILCFFILLSVPANKGLGGKVTLSSLYRTPRKGLASHSRGGGASVACFRLKLSRDSKSMASFPDAKAGKCLHIRVKCGQSYILSQEEYKIGRIS